MQLYEHITGDSQLVYFLGKKISTYLTKKSKSLTQKVQMKDFSLVVWVFVL